MQNLNSTSDLAIKIQKLARLAFDPAAADGESINAVRMIVQFAKKNQVNYDGFKKLLGVVSTAADLKTSYPPYIMPFGQYRGRRFEEIYRTDPDYLLWVLQSVIGRKKLKAQILTFLKTKQN